MDKKLLPIGIDNFEMLITRNYYYVDKTMLIKDLLDNKAAVNLFTRPRRFGKTLNISMIQNFFENTKKDNSYLFEGLDIMRAGEKYTSHMGMYPVINLSLKSAKQPTYELAFQCLREEISKEFQRHEYVLESHEITHQRQRFEDIMDGKEDEGLYVKSLQFLSECLEIYHKKKVIILIDEYDVPLENSFFRGFYERMIDFIRSLLESALKSNPHLEFSVITGCLRISKESIFTGLNNLEIVSILNKSYDEYFGFTQKDIDKMLSSYGLLEKRDLVKEWYNGYVFGDTEVYNPWSAVRFVKDLSINRNTFPSSYWSNTSSNSIVKSLIEQADSITKNKIEQLIEGKTIEIIVHEDITYDEVYDSVENIWDFMFFTGYFRKVSERMDEDDNHIITLKIPNKEVKQIFKNKVLKWFNEKVKVKDLSKMYTAIFDRDVEVFQEELSNMLQQSISFNDSYENFYHGFTVGVLGNMHDKLIKSNRESGDGRSDIFIKSLSIFKPAVILELKVCRNPKDIFKMCDEALEQIERKKYDFELREEGYENIIKYGISFYGKDCLIKVKA